MRKQKIDQLMKMILLVGSILISCLFLGMVIFLLIKGSKVFLVNYPKRQNIIDFLLGMMWFKDREIYGAGFLIINTLISALLAFVIACPIAILNAMFIEKIAKGYLKILLQSVVELLAAIPSVVYGLFALKFIVLLIDKVANLVGYTTYGGNCLLTVVILLAIMIYPNIVSMSCMAIRSVSKDIEQASLALGASKIQTYFKVILNHSKSGIIAGCILAMGRALGEASAVSMVCGNKIYGISWNIFEPTRTITTSMLAGIKETTGLDYDMRFALALLLIMMILLINAIFYYLKQRLGSKYV